MAQSHCGALTFARRDVTSKRKVTGKKTNRQEIKARGTSLFSLFKQKRESLFRNLNFYTVAVLSG